MATRQPDHLESAWVEVLTASGTVQVQGGTVYAVRGPEPATEDVGLIFSAMQGRAPFVNNAGGSLWMRATSGHATVCADED